MRRKFAITGSHMLYESMLKSDEEHIDYLSTQKRLIAALGLADYIKVQTHPNAAHALHPPGVDKRSTRRCPGPEAQCV
jgi:hypothetical protein